jgi:UV DNA damage endonuclease
MQQQYKLGLVCISEILKQKNKGGFKTMTRAGFKKFGSRQDAIACLSDRILHNSKLTGQILKHLHDHGIAHYRCSSSMFPLISDPETNVSLDDLPDIADIKANMASAGDFARLHKISVSFHPDQFNVLVSYNPEVVARTINELNHQSATLDMMGFSQDFGSPMCLHLNKSPDLKKETLNQYVQRFVENLAKCSTGVQNRLVLENEDKGFWNCHNLNLYFGRIRPLVYDNLHDDCNISDSLPLQNAKDFIKTWPESHIPVFHWSESAGLNRKTAHATDASYIPQVVLENPEVVWEVELKGKDVAILKIFEKMKEL